jgi:hypothetical protein
LLRALSAAKKSQQQAANNTRERLFVDCAKVRLKPETMQAIWQDVEDRIHNVEAQRME